MSSPPSVEDRGARLVLGVAMALSAALILYESRGTTFFNDEWVLFQRFAADFDLEAVLMPFNGHLIGLGSLIFDGGLAAFGPAPLFFRLVGIAAFLGMAAVLYVYLRRLVSPWLALAPVVVLLFCGAAWEVLLWPMSNINTSLSVGAGVGALLALERPGGRRDLMAATLLAVGIAAGTYAIAFLVGAAISVLGGRDRWARAWVFLVPLTLYVAWWLWAQRFDQDAGLEVANVWLFPSFSMQSLAVVLAALTGLAATLDGDGINPTIEIDAGWGRFLAIAALVGLALRLVRGSLPLGFWAALAALVSCWALLTLGFGPDRLPEESRYVVPGLVLVAMVAGQAMKGTRVPRPAAIAVGVVAVAAIATGVRQLHDGGLFLRDYSDRARATLAGIEEAEATIDPLYVPTADPELDGVVPAQLPVAAGSYLEAVRHHGSPAFTPEELGREPEAIRQVTEDVRVAAIAFAAGTEPPD